MTTGKVPTLRISALISEELAFYRELYFLLDKQHDCLAGRATDDLCDITSAIGRVQTHIESHERVLQQFQRESPEAFEAQMKDPKTNADRDRIALLIADAQRVLGECIGLARKMRADYHAELGQMGVGRLLLSSMGRSPGQPLFFDQSP